MNIQNLYIIYDAKLRFLSKIAMSNLLIHNRFMYSIDVLAFDKLNNLLS